MSKPSPTPLTVLTGVLALAVLTLSLSALAEGSVQAEPLQIPRASAGIVIDGRLDDWGLSPGQRLAVRWDDSFLFVAVQVQDGTPDGGDDRTRDFAGSDRAVLLVSAAPQQGPPATEGELLGDRDFAFIFVPYSPFHRPLKSIYGFGGYEHVEFDLRQVALASVPEAGGFALEARLPWKPLGIFPATGMSLGLQLLVYDPHRSATPLALAPRGSGEGVVHRGLIAPAVLGP